MNGRAPQDLLDITVRDFVGGQKLFNRYRLVRTLGRGGMGVVWLAQDDELEREVALKFLPDLIIHDRSVLGDLKRETKRSLELTHKNIVRIYDFINDERSAAISMEFVDGDTLSNLRADRPNKVFEPPELVDWINQACEALNYAHSHAQVIHRDLKPSNLMVNKRNEVKVADFGIARRLGDSVSMMTMGRSTSGTLVYMSPQQLDGDRGTPADDIYSFGATLYELITSKPPFFSGNVDRQIREKRQPSMMHRRLELEIEGEPIDPLWEELVADCLQKDPALRPQSIMAIAERLVEQPQRSFLASFFYPDRPRTADRPTGTHTKPETKPETKSTKPKTVKPKREPRYLGRRAGAAIGAAFRSGADAAKAPFVAAGRATGKAAAGVGAMGGAIGRGFGQAGRGSVSLFQSILAGAAEAIASVFRGAGIFFQFVGHVLLESVRTIGQALVALALGIKLAGAAAGHGVFASIKVLGQGIVAVALGAKLVSVAAARGSVVAARKTTGVAEVSGRAAASFLTVAVKETIGGTAIVIVPAAIVGLAIWFFALRPPRPAKPVFVGKPETSASVAAASPVQPRVQPSPSAVAVAATPAPPPVVVAAAPQATPAARPPAPPPPPAPAPAAADGSLRFESVPPGAHVKIDNVTSEDTPVTVANVSPGSHHVQVTMDQYKTVDFDIIVKSGEFFTVPPVVLEPINPAAPPPPPDTAVAALNVTPPPAPPSHKSKTATARTKPSPPPQKQQPAVANQASVRRPAAPPAPSAKPATKPRGTEQPVLPFQGTAPGG